MPYIKKEDRHGVLADGPDTEGDLNYLITCTVRNYIRQVGLNYKSINTVVGALECAKLELYRRVAATYEDKQIKENGDVYPKEWVCPTP